MVVLCAFVSAGPFAAGSDGEMNFGVTGDAAPNSASSRTVSVLLCFPLSSWYRTLLVGIRCNKAGIDGKSFCEASLHYRFKNMSQNIVLPEQAMAMTLCHCPKGGNADAGCGHR
ncbi:hypothetical protein P3T33_004726 [Rhizobium sp. AN67]|nr:hypothetical protein [Rhizobium sp. AN67]